MKVPFGGPGFFRKAVEVLAKQGLFIDRGRELFFKVPANPRPSRRWGPGPGPKAKGVTENVERLWRTGNR